MAEEMIAVIGEAPDSDDGDPWCFVPEVSAASGGRSVVVTHSVNNRDDLNGMEQQGFKLRRQQLMGHLRRALDEIPDTPRAIREAFSRMNSELESNIFKGSSCEGGFWLCQYNSTVVVVGSAHVYVAGDSGATVILSRAGKDIELTDEDLMCDIGVYRGSVEKITDLCYYRKERITENDEFLTICTSHTLAHVDGDFTPVLTTRVAAFGLVEAAKQIAGEYIDDTRTFVIVPLQGGAELCIKQKAEADLNHLGARKSVENVEEQIAMNERRRSEAVAELMRLKEVIRNPRVERKEKLLDLKRELQSKEEMLVELEVEMKELELKQEKGKGDAKFFRKKRQEYIARNLRRRSEGVEEVRKLEKIVEEKLLALKMKSAEESEPGKLGWVNIRPLFAGARIPDDEERKKRTEQAMKKLRDYYEKHPEEQGEMEAMDDSYPGLKPLENGERQTPEPHTWCGGKTYRYSASIRVFFSPQHIRVIYAGFELDLLSVVEWKSGTGYLGLPEHPLANQLCKAAKVEGSIQVYGLYEESYPREGRYRACVAADQKSFEALVAATDQLAFLGEYWDVSPRPLGFLGDPYALEEASKSF